MSTRTVTGKALIAASDVLDMLEDERVRAVAYESCLQRAAAWNETKNNAFVFSAIRTRREELGLGQREVSQMIGIDSSAISKLESGKLQPSLPTFLALMFVLNIPLENMVVFPKLSS